MTGLWNRSESPLQRPLPWVTFAPLAWLKLQYFCHAGNTEIGGFGIARADNALYIEDFQTVEQQVTPVSVRFADYAVADFYDRCVDQGLTPSRFGRIWCHTHPGESVTPSGTDEETFARCFGSCDWAILFILGRTGKTYARLSFSAGPGAELLLPVAVDWSVWPRWLESAGTSLEKQHVLWRQEFAQHIHSLPDPFGPLRPEEVVELFQDYLDWEDYPLSGQRHDLGEPLNLQPLEEHVAS